MPLSASAASVVLGELEVGWLVVSDCCCGTLDCKLLRGADGNLSRLLPVLLRLEVLITSDWPLCDVWQNVSRSA